MRASRDIPGGTTTIPRHDCGRCGQSRPLQSTLSRKGRRNQRVGQEASPQGWRTPTEQAAASSIHVVREGPGGQAQKGQFPINMGRRGQRGITARRQHGRSSRTTTRAGAARGSYSPTAQTSADQWCCAGGARLGIHTADVAQHPCPFPENTGPDGGNTTQTQVPPQQRRKANTGGSATDMPVDAATAESS